MSKRNNNRSNTVDNSSNSSAPRAKRYVARHEEPIEVELNGKMISIRRIWDSKKKEVKNELLELSQMQDPYKRGLAVIATCLAAVGIKWSDSPVKEVGKITWQEGDTVYEAPATKIKFLQNGGQLRLVRNADGTERIDLDVVTKTTVNQVIRDCQDWTDEDQLALENYTSGLARRKADRERHRRYEKAYVSEFRFDEAFVRAGL